MGFGGQNCRGMAIIGCTEAYGSIVLDRDCGNVPRRGGAFITEGIEPMQHFAEGLVESAGAWEGVASLGIHCLVGALVGMIAVLTVKGITTISGNAST